MAVVLARTADRAHPETARRAALPAELGVVQNREIHPIYRSLRKFSLTVAKAFSRTLCRFYNFGIMVLCREDKPVSVNEFLKQRAVNIVLSGQYELANWLDVNGKPRTFACRTSRVSPFRMIVAAPVIGKIGDRIAIYFGDFGSLEGRVSDAVAGEFLLELSMTRSLRRKMADKLSWLEKKEKDSSILDVRKQARIIPANPHSALTFGDGSVHGCFVVDLSVSGAAVSAEVQPNIGAPLALGACVGRVVRHIANGFAIQFVEPQIRATLEYRIARPARVPMPAGAKTAPRANTGTEQPVWTTSVM
ncbi:hypothetical protein V1282_003980 [Nitrobacteraceae bacterium AZCC 2146]